MAGFEERIYELGAEALAEQERQVTEVRSRGPTLLAGGAVIASLLARPVFHGGHPDGVAEGVAATLGLLGFSVKAGATYRALWDQGILDQPMVDIALAEAFEDRRSDNARVVKQLVAFLALALASLVLETAGLAAAAALAS